MDVLQYIEQTANIGTGSNRIPFRCANKVVYITNDSSLYPMRYTFNGYSSQDNGVLLKPGETDSDILIPHGFSILDISVEAINGAVPYRIMGV